VLINTSLRPYGPVHWRLRPSSYALLLRLLLLPQTPASREEAILRLTSGRAHLPNEILSDWVSYHQNNPVTGANALRQLIAAGCYRCEARPPETAFLILASQRDALVDVRCSRMLAAAWNVPIAEHANAGHDLPLDDGAWVANQVAAWASSVG
jgi:pimeloyl-ACP methyl ester carboxylesterase